MIFQRKNLAVLVFPLSFLCAGCGTGITIVAAAMLSPSINQVSPQVVAAGTPSVTVTVQGANFEAKSSLMVNGTAVPTTMVNTTTLAANISGSTLAQPAVAQLQVKNSNGAASNQYPLTVSNASQGGGSLSIATTQMPNAQAGTPYQVTLNANGGVTPYMWKVSGGSLPPGLSLTYTGVLSGTPTTSGTYTFNVSAVDSSQPVQTKTSTYTLVVSAAPAAVSKLSISTTSLASGQVGSSYSTSLSASGGTTGYTWSLASGSLPAGLSLSSGGAITGTPKAAGSVSFTVQVADSSSPAQTATAQESITIAAASLAVSSANLPAAQSGNSYNATLNATGGTPGYTWTVSSGSLPSGLSLSSAGILSGSPKASGSFSFTVQVKDSGSPAQTATAQESITVAAPGLAVTSANLSAATNGSSYSATLSAAGGTPGYTWSISSGSLPAGLSLSSAGVISGTPTATGTSSFTVQVKDSGSPAQTATAQESITVAASGLSITSTSLASGLTGSAYSASLAATGGTPGYTWSIASGSLPAGLSLASNGAISGTPTTQGVSKFTVQVKDSGSPAQTASLPESITIAASAPPLNITSTSLGAAQTGSSYSTTLSANGGTPSYTWSVASGSLPAGLTMSSSGVISGTPTASGSFSFTVKVQDSASPAQTASAQESITVSPEPLAVLTTSLASGTSGASYSATLAATGGSPSYNWTISAGSLPAGLSLSSDGTISGTPTASGTANFTVQVSDSASPAQTASSQESITVTAPTVIAPGVAQLYVYPQAPVAVRGSYQTVTAIVTGVSDKTVTWSSDGGSIVGTNPCVTNEPCTVALYSANPGTYHLKATSNADHSVMATSTVIMTAPQVQRTDHPRFMVTSDMLTSLRSKATPSDVAYQGIKQIASLYYGIYSSSFTYSTWNGSACVGGSGPTSDQSQSYIEADVWWMALVSLFDPDSATRNQYGCAARDLFLANTNYVLNGTINVRQGNRWADNALSWALMPDYLMGGGYLSTADVAVARQFLQKIAYDQINDIYNGTLAVIGNYNSPTQFMESDENSITGMRAMGNNYTHARILILSAAALTFNDDPTDDPPMSNTCNATRYQVCPDGTAGSLHAYWSYVNGGMLYKDWADMETGDVVQPAYNTAFNNLPSQPMCNTLWHTPIPCMGQGRGGESSEGTSYGASMEKLRWALNSIHTAGYDDPVVYGPQMSLETTSFWDLHYLADLTQLTGLSGISTERSRWSYFTDGDTLNYYTYPSNYATEAAMLTADSYVGRGDRSAPIQWLVANTAFGMAAGQAGGCISYCGLANEIGNDFASGSALDLFIATPNGDPAANVAGDPRTSLPTDWYNAGNQHLVVRDGGWTTDANTIFSFYCANTQIDHEHQYCGRFDIYSQGEYITKGRMEFNDYINEVSVSTNQNLPAYINNPNQTGCTFPNCYFANSTVEGGQLWHGYQAGLDPLLYSELPGYVAAIADYKNSYNGGWGGFGQLNGVTGASRSLIYLRGSNQLVYYDRGDTGSNAWDKANYLVTTGAPSFSGNTATWLTRSGNQRVYWTQLEPSGNNPSLDLAYTDADASNDWEIYGRIKEDAGAVPSARFLSVLQWGSATGTVAAPSTILSTSGTTFEGARVGSSVVMFMHDWPAAFNGVTYPASGATTQYVSDLTPNTTYTITGAGAPATATTDSAGVLAFSAAGTGNITISTH